MKIRDFIDNEELVRQNLDDIKSRNEYLNAVVTYADIDKQLKYVDENIEKSAPLYKVPVVVKDNITTKDILTTASSEILSNYEPVFDATVIKKLKSAGAIINVKAALDELGMGGTGLNAATGPVKNPYNDKVITGGSSSGSAALVGDGLSCLALGTDTGDSIRRPAALCGAVGVKPTYGRISRYGVIPYASSLDTVGYFTTNVEDAALALEVMAGRDDLDMTSSYEPVANYSKSLSGDLKGKKVAIIKNVQDVIENEQLIDNFNMIVDEMKKAGAIVEEIELDDKLMKVLLPVYLLISNAEATANHSNLDGIRFGNRIDGENLEEIMMNSRTKGFSSYVKKRFVIGSYSLFVENQDKIFRKAQKVRRLIVEELSEKMKDYDAIIACACPDVAPTPDNCFDEDLNDVTNVADNYMLLANFSGYPSMTIPTGIVDDLPIAINLTCKPFEEEIMFNIAKGIEKIANFNGKGGCL